LKPTNISLRFF